MFFQINGLEISNLQKAQRPGIISVDIIANHLTEDESGETILREAFSPETVKEFLDIGVIEFWHESKNPILSKKEKNENLLGRPVGFRWENGLPVVKAELTEKHPIVQTMLPHLEAQNPVYAASVGGSKIVLQAQGKDGRTHKVIPKIKWDHLAIAPANMVVNREAGVNVRMLKARELYVEFDSMDSFKKNSSRIMENESVLMKTLYAPESVSDLYQSPGGVVTRQSFGEDLSLSEEDALRLIETMIRVKNGELPLTRSEYFDAFPSNVEFADKSYRLFDKFFNSKKGDSKR